MVSLHNNSTLRQDLLPDNLRLKIELVVESLIDLLDEAHGDPDLEPNGDDEPNDDMEQDETDALELGSDEISRELECIGRRA